MKWYNLFCPFALFHDLIAANKEVTYGITQVNLMDYYDVFVNHQEGVITLKSNKTKSLNDLIIKLHHMSTPTDRYNILPDYNLVVTCTDAAGDQHKETVTFELNSHTTHWIKDKNSTFPNREKDLESIKTISSFDATPENLAKIAKESVKKYNKSP